MEYYKTIGGTYIKGNEQHVLVIHNDGVIDNSGDLTLRWYKQEYNVKPITKSEFDEAMIKIVHGLNQFSVL